MSVQTQIDRLNAIKQRIRTNLVAQGITVPEDTMLEAMAEQILSVAGEDGKDYVLTEADKSEIAALVIDMLGGNPIFGIVDEDNNIIVSGDLPDGTYSVKYEMEDGSKVNIGNLVLDTNVYYSITKNLTNCTINNSATQVVEGEPYSATITANDGYELSSVEVTMGGSPVTVTGGTISITSVTGDIVITAVAEAVAEEIKTNFCVVNGDGWITGGRCSSTGADRTDSPSCVVTNYIAVQYGDVVYVENLDSESTSGSSYSGMYKSNKTNISGFLLNNPNATYVTDVSLTATTSQFTINNANAGYIRVCGKPVGEHSDIIVNIKRNGAWL